MTSADIKTRSDRYLFPVYTRAPLALVRGCGTRVWDADGREYLDFFSSTVVTVLGHCHPAVLRAIEAQARRIWHVSNLHYCEPQALLAERSVIERWNSWFKGHSKVSMLPYHVRRLRRVRRWIDLKLMVFFTHQYLVRHDLRAVA